MKKAKYKFPKSAAFEFANTPYKDGPDDLEHRTRVTLRNWQVLGSKIVFYSSAVEDRIRSSDAVPKRVEQYEGGILKEAIPSAVMFVPETKSVMPICWVGLCTNNFTFISESKDGFAVSVGVHSDEVSDIIVGNLTDNDMEIHMQLWVIAFELSLKNFGNCIETRLGNWEFKD